MTKSNDTLRKHMAGDMIFGKGGISLDKTLQFPL